MTRELHADVLVVGAGPGGLAAAAAARESGADVLVVDENPGPGGQIWRTRANAAPHARTAALLERAAGARFEAGVSIFDVAAPATCARWPRAPR